MAIPAIVAAGDRRASKAVYGESKIYLEIEGTTLVEMAVEVLQRVPEVSEVWVVGNAERLEGVLNKESFKQKLTKPVHIVPQFRNLYENLWETFRRSLPGAPTDGRDPTAEDESQQRLFLSADLPFATPHEISSFIRRGQEIDADFITGLVPEQSMEAFYPKSPGEAGIAMAYFNTAQGRFRQSNLHLVRPAAIHNRYYVEEMYEHRYQKQFGSILGLAWRLLRSRAGSLKVLFFFGLLHLAGALDRSRFRRAADRVRGWVQLPRIEATISKLFDAEFRFGITEIGGCAVDIDNEHDYDVAKERFHEWRQAQLERGESLHGALPASADENS